MRLGVPLHRRLSFALAAILFTLLIDNTARADSFKAQIIEGTPVDESQFPYVARLNYQGDLLCTGTLITPKHILTAAHCFFGENGRRAVGDAAIVARLNGQEISSSRVTIHPAYRAGQSACAEGETDAAIIELSQEASGIQPVPLLPSRVPLGANLTIVGYGTEGSGSSGEGNTIPAVGIVNHGRTVVEGFGANVGDNNPNSSYYYWRFDQGESNTASGDSGGPAFYDVDGERFISGITCGGDGRAEYGTYSWNTRADLLTSWAASVTGRSPAGPPPAGTPEPVPNTPVQPPATNPTPPPSTTPAPPQEESLNVLDAFLVLDGSRDDVLEISGDVFVGRKFSPRGKKITVRIGGYARTFRLGRNGRSTGRGKSYFELSGDMRGGKFKDSTVTYTLYLKRVPLFGMLPDMGFSMTDEAEDGDQALMSITMKINRISREATFVLGFDPYEEEWVLVDDEDAGEGDEGDEGEYYDE